MSKYYYNKAHHLPVTLAIRFLGLILSLIGIGTVIYIFSPLIIWQLTLAPAFAEQQLAIPIPQRTVVSPITIKDLVATSIHGFSVNFDNVQNWFPSYKMQQGAPRESSYFLTIRKLKITNAFVSATDTDLSKHLVSLSGTAFPPDKGNTVIFGHSTLPQLFNANDYKTIFANAHTLQVEDTIETIVDNVTYTYVIYSITVVDPEDTSSLSQHYDDSYLTIITCTPPGTIWKRLVIKSRLQKLT